MFTTGHLTSGLALGFALGLEGPAFWALVAASVLVDWDYAFQLLTGRNHRTFLTHSPPVYAAVLVPVALVEPLAWYVLGGALLHFMLDLWEYGLRLNPFQRRIYGMRLIPGIETLSFLQYLRTYFRDRRFFFAEAGFAAAAFALGAWRFTS